MEYDIFDKLFVSCKLHTDNAPLKSLKKIFRMMTFWGEFVFPRQDTARLSSPGMIEGLFILLL